jgi:catechol 2,3-dioxygenase-like lactoylglutathione lyase family enzyme
MFKLSVSLFFLAATLASAQPPARPAITGVAFMRLYASDPAATQHFYSDTLGLERTELKDRWVYPVNHAQWIEILPTAPPKPNERMAAVAFTTANAAGLVKYLQAHNIALAEPLHDGEFAVRDPEGNLVIFIDRKASDPAAKIAAAAPPSPHAISDRVIHVGFIVVSRETEDAFWRDLLGFRPYWYGGPKPGKTDYVSLQVPDGTDWLEYMLPVKPDSDLHTHGVMDHFSLGVASMPAAIQALAANGCTAPSCSASKLGVDGKVQLNLYDPDQTRAEVMEFAPSGPTCCSPFTGPHPSEAETGR